MHPAAEAAFSRTRPVPNPPHKVPLSRKNASQGKKVRIEDVKNLEGIFGITVLMMIHEVNVFLGIF